MLIQYAKAGIDNRNNGVSMSWTGDRLFWLLEFNFQWPVKLPVPKARNRTTISNRRRCRETDTVIIIV